MKIRAIGVFAAGLVGVAVAGAQTVYVASSDGQFGTLNLSTGAYTLINVPTFYLGGLGYGPGGQLYGLANNGNLYTVSATGVETLVGPTGINEAGGWGMGGGPGGVLWGQGDGQVYSINPTTGGATALPMPLGYITGAVPVTDNAGNLYLGNSGTGNLFSINTTTGASSLIGFMTTNGVVEGMAWAGGSMWAADYSGFTYRINPATAAATEVATYNLNDAGEIFAMASQFNAVPEPAPLAALGLGALFLLRRKRPSPPKN